MHHTVMRVSGDFWCCGGRVAKRRDYEIYFLDGVENKNYQNAELKILTVTYKRDLDRKNLRGHFLFVQLNHIF